MVVEATGLDTRNHSAEACMHGMPSKNSRNKKIKKESSKFNSRFRDGGYIILVEKLTNKVIVNPRHMINTTPSLNCCTLTRPLQSRQSNCCIKYTCRHTFALIHIGCIHVRLNQTGLHMEELPFCAGTPDLQTKPPVKWSVPSSSLWTLHHHSQTGAADAHGRTHECCLCVCMCLFTCRSCRSVLAHT